MPDAFAVSRALRDAYFRYYDTPFAMRNDGLMAERRALLDADGVSWREPWLDLLPEYETLDKDLGTAFAEAGAAPSLLDFTRLGILAGNSLNLRRHQYEVLQNSLGGRHVVITAGTGSGKTEAIFLPVISAAAEESHRLGPEYSGQAQMTGGQGPSTFVPQRDAESGRPPAVRALILYPMNALVEDQLVRLRRALDGPARTRLARRAPGRPSVLLRPVHRARRRCRGRLGQPSPRERPRSLFLA